MTCVVRRRMVRPYWLVCAGTLLHHQIDKTPLRGAWRWSLRLLWILWGFSKRITTAEVCLWSVPCVGIRIGETERICIMIDR